jgi:membrane fusion protein, multidrug efflux system
MFRRSSGSVAVPRAGGGFVLLILGSLLLGGCGGGGDAADAGDSSTPADTTVTSTDGAEDEGATTQRRERAVTVNVSEAQRIRLVVPVVAEGSVRARRSADIKFEISGKIMQVLVQEGQRVRRGQRLATLDDREYQLALEEARSNRLQALGQLAVEDESMSSEGGAVHVLDAQLAELAAMHERGEITAEERRAREVELGVAAVKRGAYRRELLEVRTGLTNARSAEQRAELDLERTELRAPFDGVVSGLVLTNGERVQPGEMFCTIVDDVDVEAEVGVLEADLRGLQVGRPVLVTVPALGETFAAKVDVVSPRIDPQSRTCQVLIRLRSEDGKIKPGMFVRASIAGAMYEDRLVVPREAILTRDGRPLVFRVEEERAKWVYVETGLRNDHVVEITRVVQGGAIDPGTRVVVDNHLTLTHDARIEIRDEVPIVDPWASLTAPTAAPR